MRSEKQDMQRRAFIAFSDLAILIALKNHAFTGYGINRYFLEKVGDAASPSTVYTSLASLERKGWIECITERRGRVYALTEEAQKAVSGMPDSVEEIKRFIEKILKK